MDYLESGEIRTIFFYWLEQKGYKEAYLKNHENSSLKYRFDIVNKVNYLNCHRLIGQAFTWYNTKEGDKFWYDLSMEWKELCAKNQLKDILNKLCQNEINIF